MTTSTTNNTTPAPRFPAWRRLVARGDVCVVVRKTADAVAVDAPPAALARRRL